ncbi:MAG: hypothetical protein WBM64_15500 [Woeseiaceae bacterium]
MNNTILLTTRWPGWRPVSMAVLAVVLIAFSSPGFAAKGGTKGPPTGGETSNNLSIPGILTESSPEVSVEAYWSVTDTPVLGEHYSYGCPGEEYWEEFKYTNTSCVDHLMEPTVHYTAEQCVAVDMPCAGMDVSELSRIYWQKEPLNEWWATDDGVSPNTVAVAYVDWGDALEAVSWTERSVVRVETQPWSSTIPGFSPVTACVDAAEEMDPETTCKVGLQMWHVSGQGITEHWGVRATEPTEVDPAISYNFDSPFQIIKTANAGLNVTKMVEGDATCSQPGGNPGDDPPAVGGWTGSEWSGTCTVYDDPYTVETSVGGKYVYGYNLRMKDISPSEVCGAGWEKTGFYRLTFYAPNDVDFTGHSEATPIPNVAPPSVPSEVRTLPRNGVFNTITVPPEPEPVIEAESDEEDPDADDRLYRPVIDPVNNLTYLDICIVAKSQGGGGGGGKPGGGGGGGSKGGKH